MTPDLNALSVFALVAELKSFSAAADRMGVSRSAVSQTIRRLEDMLCLALVLRTTRSVSLTEAGEGLYANIAPAIAEMSAAVDRRANCAKVRTGCCGLPFLPLPKTSCPARFLLASPPPIPTFTSMSW